MNLIHKILQNILVRIILMSIVFMATIRSFDVTTIDFYAAILQAVLFEYFLKWCSKIRTKS
jgi:membrane protein CcdC involved in cytochrome C biogenesis